MASGRELGKQVQSLWLPERTEVIPRVTCEPCVDNRRGRRRKNGGMRATSAARRNIQALQR